MTTNTILPLERLKQQKNIVIYGAGRIGTLILWKFRQIEARVSEFWDKNAAILEDIEHTPVVFPRLDIPDKHNVFIVVAVIDHQISKIITSNLKSHGFTNILSGKSTLFSLLNSICLSQVHTGTHQLDSRECDRCIAHIDNEFHCKISDDAFISTYSDSHDVALLDRVIIPTLGLVITNKCNLRCQGCNHLQDHDYTYKRKEIDPDVLVSDLRKITDSADLIRRLVIVGGETFVYKNIFRLIKEVSLLRGIGLIEVITNGTILPKDDSVFSLLANPRFHVTISDYNAKNNLNEILLANRALLMERLNAHGVSHSLFSTIEWFDLGGFEDRNYLQSQRKQIFKSCCFITNDMFDGVLYKCSRSAFSTLLKKIPDTPSDYINIRNCSSSKILRRKLQEFLQMSDLAACQFCSGNYGKRITAGIQARK